MLIRIGFPLCIWSPSSESIDWRISSRTNVCLKNVSRSLFRIFETMWIRKLFTFKDLHTSVRFFHNEVSLFSTPFRFGDDKFTSKQYPVLLPSENSFFCHSLCTIQNNTNDFISSGLSPFKIFEFTNLCAFRKNTTHSSAVKAYLKLAEALEFPEKIQFIFTVATSFIWHAQIWMNKWVFSIVLSDAI